MKGVRSNLLNLYSEPTKGDLPQETAAPVFVNNLVGREINGLIERFASAHCAAAASPVEGCLGLLTVITSRQCLVTEGSCLEPTGYRSFSSG